MYGFDTQEALQEAAALIEAGQKDEANAVLRQVLDEEPQNADAWYLFAAAAPIKSYAIRHLNKALTLDPNHEKARLALQRIQTAPQRKKARRTRRRVLMTLAVLAVVVFGAIIVMLTGQQRAHERSEATLAMMLALASQAPTQPPTPIVPTATPAIPTAVAVQIAEPTAPSPPLGGPTSTPAPQMPVLAEGESLLYFKPFDSALGWNPAGDTANGSVTVEGGAVRVRNSTPNVVLGDFDHILPFSNARFEVDVRKEAGPLNDAYGLLLRLDDANGAFYFFAISSDGYATIAYCNAWCTADLTTLIPWTVFPVINQGVGAANRLQVTLDGSELTFFVNDSPVGTVTDVRLWEGYAGLGAYLLEEGESVVTFDNLAVYDLP